MARSLFALPLLVAVCVHAQTPGPVKPPESAAKSQPCIAIPDDEKGPPRLKRGKPTERPARPECETLATPIGAPVVYDSEGKVVATPPPEATAAAAVAEQLPIMERVRIQSEEYTQKLPNFLTTQLIRRYQSPSVRLNWNMRDYVEVEVAFVDGTEQYRNAKRNGKSLSYDETKKTGAWSKGEFGTVLREITTRGEAAKFTYKKRELIGTVDTEVYEYSVPQPYSGWTLEFEGQSIRPAYKGRVWVDTKQFLLMRIEMEAVQLPSTFPVDHAETTLDYGSVKIGSGWYLLPTKSENLACFRFHPECSRNEIEFRNYRKFSAESTISTTESSVTFDGEEKKPPPAPAPKNKKK